MNWQQMRDEIVAEVIQQAAEEAMRLYASRFDCERGLRASAISGSGKYMHTAASQFKEKRFLYLLHVEIEDMRPIVIDARGWNKSVSWKKEFDYQWSAQELTAGLDELHAEFVLSRNWQLAELLEKGGGF